MKKAIVTGAGGFIGSHVVTELVNNGIEVLAIDRPTNCHKVPKLSGVRCFGCDVSQIESVVEIVEFGAYDVFFHFAWTGSSGQRRANHQLQLDNALSTVKCIRIAKRIGCQKFVCAGSIMELETMAAINKQGNKPGTGYVYGVGKITAHCLSKIVAADEGVELMWGMITNAYGEGETSPRFVNSTIRNIIRGEQLQFTAATQNYDFIHIDDVACAFRLIGEKGKAFCEYIIGSGNAKPLREYICELCDTVAPECKYSFGDVPFTGVGLPLNVFDTHPILNDCGFVPSVSFSEGIKRTASWIKEVDGFD